MKSRAAAVLVASLMLAGCASSGVRELTQAELDLTKRLHSRLDENGEALYSVLDGLTGLATEAIRDQHTLSLSISKAKLLESMRSPWIQPHPDLAATQKEVAFYHLFALAEAEASLFEARLEERRASVEEIRKAYGTLAALTAQIIEAEELILAHLNQPANAQISLFLGNLLTEVRAFREELSASENPRLKALAGDVERAEGRVGKATELIEKALETIMTKADG